MFELKLVVWLVVALVVLVAYWLAWPRRGKKRSSRRREYVLGLGSMEVDPGKTRTLSARAFVCFRPERLIVPSNLAKDFLIVNLSVGNNHNQLASVGVLPAVMFTEAGGGIRLGLDMAMVGTTVSVTATNHGDQECLFAAGVVGPAVGRAGVFFARARKWVTSWR